MAQNNIYMEDENLVIYVDVLPEIQDTVTDAAASASVSAASASASVSAASILVESIRNIKSGAELFVSQAIENLHDLNSNILAGISSLYDTVVQRIQQTEANVLTNVQNLGSEYVNDAKNYAQVAQEIVDFHVSTEHLNQSKAIETGDLSDDAIVIQNIRKYAHSTFDSTKFTKEGSPTVTANGVANEFSTSNYLKTGYLFNTTKPWTIYTGKIRFTSVSSTQFILCTSYDNTVTNNNCPIAFCLNNSARLRLGLASTNNYGNTSPDIAADVVGTKTYSANTDYYFKLEFTGSQYVASYSTDGVTYTADITITSSTTVASGYVMIGARIYLKTTAAPLNGSIDLKQISIIVDGVPVFSGNKTGTDTYTIGGNSVSIPYTLSKTGSKIVDGYYRTQLTALYEQQGYVPYYTLSDSDFTLPMGEIYGMIEILRQQIDALNT